MLEKLRQHLKYDPETGEFTRLIGCRGRRAGDKAGSIDSAGYVQVMIFGKLYRGHRLAWFYVHGEWPKGVIDHINGNPLDNRLCNLRDVTKAANQANRVRPERGNKTGMLGVVKRGESKFLAFITRGRRQKYLGTFKTADEAHAEYIKARQELDSKAVC
jgi:hypothetical protein